MQYTKRHIRVTTTIAAVALLALLFLLPQALGAPSGKLRGGLTETGLDSPQVQTFLITPRNLSDVTAVSDMLDRMGVSYSFKRIGEVIIADMPGENALALLANDEIKEVWPDLEVVSFDEEALTQVNARVAWGLGYTGEGQKIAILDTGIDASHPAFQDRVVLARNFSSSPTVNDLYGHGTHVAGIAAGYGDVNGVATQALLFNGKVLNDSGSGNYSSVINGINWAVENGASVINLSLGGLTPDHDTPLNQAVRDAMNAGAVVSVAAGNCGEGCPSGACGPFRGITMPGNTKEALTVGAVNSQNSHACFSAGENIEGVGIKPDIVAPGVEIISSLPGGGHGRKTGTSMSTPFVAGASALAWEAHPLFTPIEIKNVLQNISRDLGENGKDVLFGSGLLDLTDIESTDTNGDGGDENGGGGGGNGGDSNQMGENFFFYGPTELVKNENGEYEVEFIGGEGMSLDLWTQANEQDTTVQFTVFDEFGTVIDYNTIGPVELNDGDLNHYRFLNNFAPDRVGNFVVQAEIYQNGELREGSLGAEENVLVASAEKNVFVTLPPDMIEVQEFQMPPHVNKGGVFSVQVPAKNTGLIDVNVFAEIMLINDQNSVAEVMDSSVVEIRAGGQEALEINGPVMVPSGDYNAKITIFFENQKTWAYSSLSVRISGEPLLEGTSIPTTMRTGENTAFSVTLHNTSAIELAPSVYVYFLDGNQAIRTFFDTNHALAPGETRAVEFDWLVDETAKDYNVVVEAWTENTVESAEQEVRILDESPPLIEGIEFEPVVWKNAPNPVRVRASDFSKIKSIEMVFNSIRTPMNRVGGSDSNAEYTSAVKTTLSLGPKRFRVRACDEFGNCTESAEQVFSVTPLPDYCENKLSLLVVDNNAVNATRNSTGLSKGDVPGCSAEWKTKEHGFPNLAFTTRFNYVIWSAGNYFGQVIDGNEPVMLDYYANNGGKLFIEGSDVSSEHPFDAFALNVLHSEFALEIGQDENFGGGNGNGGGEGGQGNWWSDDWNFARPINYTGEHDAVDGATIFEFYMDTTGLVNGGDENTNSPDPVIGNGFTNNGRDACLRQSVCLGNTGRCWASACLISTGPQLFYSSDSGNTWGNGFVYGNAAAGVSSVALNQTTNELVIVYMSDYNYLLRQCTVSASNNCDTNASFSSEVNLSSKMNISDVPKAGGVSAQTFSIKINPDGVFWGAFPYRQIDIAKYNILISHIVRDYNNLDNLVIDANVISHDKTPIRSIYTSSFDIDDSNRLAVIYATSEQTDNDYGLHYAVWKNSGFEARDQNFTRDGRCQNRTNSTGNCRFVDVAINSDANRLYGVWKNEIGLPQVDIPQFGTLNLDNNSYTQLDLNFYAIGADSNNSMDAQPELVVDSANNVFISFNRRKSPGISDQVCWREFYDSNKSLSGINCIDDENAYREIRWIHPTTDTNLYYSYMTTEGHFLWHTIQGINAPNLDKLQADCDDLRIISNNGGVPTEVQREIKNCNSTNTRIRHRANYAVPADAEILAGDANGYFVYYGNPSAQNPGHELREKITTYTEVDQANKLAVTDYSVSTTSPITKSEMEWVYRTIPITGDFNTEFTIRGTGFGECNNFINMCMTDDENVGSYYLNPKACVGLVSNGCNATGLVPFIGHNNGRVCSGGCEGNGRGNIVNLGTDYYGRFARKGYDAVFELYTDPERTIPFTGMPLALGVGEFDSNVFFAFNHEYLGNYGDPVGGGFSDIYFRLFHTQPSTAIGEELAQNPDQNNGGGGDSNASRGKIVFFETAPAEFTLESLDLNIDLAPYADAVTPADGNAIAIAGWDENHLAIVGHETCYAKTLFASFSLSALKQEDRQALLAQAKNWLKAAFQGRPCLHTARPIP